MPFGIYKNMGECMKKNKDKMSPGGYCAVVHKKITGNWPEKKSKRKTKKKHLI